MQQLGALDTKIVHSLPREIPALRLRPIVIEHPAGDS